MKVLVEVRVVGGGKSLCGRLLRLDREQGTRWLYTFKRGSKSCKFNARSAALSEEGEFDTFRVKDTKDVCYGQGEHKTRDQHTQHTHKPQTQYVALSMIWQV